MSKVVGLLIFFLSSTFSFGCSLDCTHQVDANPAISVDQHLISGQYELQGNSSKAIVPAQKQGTPRSGNTTSEFISASDIVLHGAISICHHNFDIIEIFSSYSTNEYHNAFSDPPDQTDFFNLLFRVIISPNAP